MFLGFGPVPAKILHAIVCVTLGEDLKDATSALQSFFAKNWPRLVASHWQYHQKRVHHWVVCSSNPCKKKRSTWTSCPSRTGSATRLSMRGCHRRSQAEASSRCPRHWQNKFRSTISRLRLILFLHLHAPIFGNKPSGCSRSLLSLTDFVGTRRNREEDEKEALASHAASSSWLSRSSLLSAHPNVIVGQALHWTYGLWRSWRCYCISFSFVQTLIAWQSASIWLSLLPYCLALLLWKKVQIGI